jgi:alpha-ribazole phosphatase
VHALQAHPSTFIDLLRHGTPQGGTRYRGHLDDPLSVEGWRQMREAVGQDCPWQRIVSSPLRRCAEFAKELATRHGLPLQIEDGFKEISFGRWEGRRVAEVFETETEAVSRYWQDPVARTPPGGEPLTGFAARVGKAWEELLREAEGEHVLLVAHGGVIRAILVHVLGMPLAHVLRLEVPVAAMSRIRVQPNVNGRPAPSLVFHAGRP